MVSAAPGRVQGRTSQNAGPYVPACGDPQAATRACPPRCRCSAGRRVTGGRRGVAGGLADAAADGAGGGLDGDDAVEHHGAGQPAGGDVRVVVAAAPPGRRALRSRSSSWRGLLEGLEPAAGPQRDVDQGDHDGHLDQRPGDAARACPLVTPNTPIATAIASSKSLLAAENASAAVRG